MSERTEFDGDGLVQFIVNGEDVNVAFFHMRATRWHHLRDRALALSHNTGRPPADWEIRRETGEWIDEADRVQAVGEMPSERFFLTLRVGCGGNYAMAATRVAVERAKLGHCTA